MNQLLSQNSTQDQKLDFIISRLQALEEKVDGNYKQLNQKIEEKVNALDRKLNRKINKKAKEVMDAINSLREVALADYHYLEKNIH
jgi:hypothetical protein